MRVVVVLELVEVEVIVFLELGQLLPLGHPVAQQEDGIDQEHQVETHEQEHRALLGLDV